MAVGDRATNHEVKHTTLTVFFINSTEKTKEMKGSKIQLILSSAATFSWSKNMPNILLLSKTPRNRRGFLGF